MPNIFMGWVKYQYIRWCTPQPNCEGGGPTSNRQMPDGVVTVTSTSSNTEFPIGRPELPLVGKDGEKQRKTAKAQWIATILKNVTWQSETFEQAVVKCYNRTTYARPRSTLRRQGSSVALTTQACAMGLNCGEGTAT